MFVRSRVADRPLLAFALVTLAWSWTAWLAESLVAEPTPILAVLVGAWGPTVAGVVVTAGEGGRPAVRDLLGRLVRWRVAPRYYLLAVAVRRRVTARGSTVACVGSRGPGGPLPGVSRSHTAAAKERLNASTG
ncbi:hypothetical protein [Salinirubrum litoreum]|uniref:Integral membrane protein n=1 Tax=Salinirubrum litoreum TaxID=1126234 RepID=A0ABD5R6B7_9EURY|nr:hypothetical protein [Salinirubrum litoreum]